MTKDKAVYVIAPVKTEDLEEVTAVEAACFPAAEAATKEQFEKRIAAYPDSFLTARLTEGPGAGRIIGFINGAVTDARTIEDEMFENAALHNPQGAYQAVFGLDVLEEYRGQGIAAALMRALAEKAKADGRKGLILTCKDRLIQFYERLGYRLLGLSRSVHGGAVWYDMILEFEP